MKFPLIPVACALAAVILVSGQTRAGEDQEPTIIEKRVVKVVVADEDAGHDVDVIELEADDLEIGESRQFITDSGKEVVITRTEDGVDITIDGEELDLPALGSLHDIDIDIDGAHSSARSMMIFKTDDEDGLDAVTKKMIIKGHGAGSHNMVFIGEDGKTVKIDGDGSDYEWIHKVHGADGLDRKIIKLQAAGGAIDHLKTSGALDSLTEEQRTAVLDALKKYDGGAVVGSDVMVIELDDEHEILHDSDHEH